MISKRVKTAPEQRKLFEIHFRHYSPATTLPSFKTESQLFIGLLLRLAGVHIKLLSGGEK
jgi:hypothetical protein